MSKELDTLEVSKQLKEFVLEAYKNGLDRMFINGSFDIIDTALKDYEELSKLDSKQITINDFYPNTIEMINDLLNLVSTKMCDFLKDGRTYTKTSLLETLGFAIRYVKTFAYGGEFNETEKIGVNARKLKALEIIKKHGLLNHVVRNKQIADLYQLTKEEYELLKEILCD